MATSAPEPHPGSADALGNPAIRPVARPGLRTREIADELIVLAPQGELVHALNGSGRKLWELCDGRLTVREIVRRLAAAVDADAATVAADVSAALLQLETLGLLDMRVVGAGAVGARAAEATRPPVRFVFGIEDRPYFHWQLAILFESLVGQFPDGWDVHVVVCNDHAPLSPDLVRLAETYEVRLLTGASHPDRRALDFAGGGERYVPMNRVEALSVVRHHVAPEDVVCLMDTDVFLFGDLQPQLFPQGNAMARNWIISEDQYFAFATKGEGGVSLPKLWEALGCTREFKPGGVTVFLTGETLAAPGLVPDIFRFLQILFLAGKIIRAADHGVWVSEMACYALAMGPNGVDYELLDIPQFAVQEQHAATMPEGSFFHYYTDINDGSGALGPFRGSQWHKQLFHDRNMLDADLESFRRVAAEPLEQRFFDLALAAAKRLGRRP